MVWRSLRRLLSARFPHRASEIGRDGYLFPDDCRTTRDGAYPRLKRGLWSCSNLDHRQSHLRPDVVARGRISYSTTISLLMSEPDFRIGVLGSGKGSNFVA